MFCTGLLCQVKLPLPLPLLQDSILPLQENLAGAGSSWKGREFPR